MKLRLILSVLFLFTGCFAARAQNPAAIPAPAAPPLGPYPGNEKLARIRQGEIDLLLVGDSITHLWDDPANRSVWSAYFEARKAVSLGYPGARTENILWMLENGVVDRMTPEVAVVMIGTNNTDSRRFPTTHTAEQIAEGIAKIVQTLRAKLPRTKILLLRIFPRADLPGAAEVGSRASALAAKLADGKTIFTLDINHVFLKPDGTLDPALMPDLRHPGPLGYLRWAQAMEPMLTKLMGKPANTATLPAVKCETDFYDWDERHEAVKALIKQQPVDLVFIGDSITHCFGGKPTSTIARAPEAWENYYGRRKAVNLGFGWDRTQQVLWRLQNGEFEGIHPRVAVVLIGTNNLTPHAVRSNTNAEIVAGIKAICATIRRKSRQTQILLMGLLPRGKEPNTVDRIRIAEKPGTGATARQE